MILLGITGGVGMGKSTVGAALAERHIPVLDTDLLARQVVEPGQEAYWEIVERFGNGFILPDGRIDRRALASVVFSNPRARTDLEAITHPRIRSLWRSATSEWRVRQEAFGAVVIPLLFETGGEAEVDKSVAVGCSAESQLERLRARDWSREEINLRIAAQLPWTEKLSRADFVIWTEGLISNAIRQLDLILCSLAAFQGPS